MDIVNDTNQDTKVKIAGGSSGGFTSTQDAEDAATWPVLPAGSIINFSPMSPPWTVCFVVNGRQVRKEVRHAARKVTLAAAGSVFRVDVE